MIGRYDDVTIGKNGKFNSGFWGQECGPEHDYTPQRWHKYMEDAISVNTGQRLLHPTCRKLVFVISPPPLSLFGQADLKATHFKKHHKYTLEWQPGAGGYLNWY